MSNRIEIELDNQGRLVLSLPLAQRLGLARGTTLVVEQETADAAYIRIQKTVPSLIEKDGIFVITGTPTQSQDTFIDEERERRSDELWGSDYARPF